jgi:hypothetical protein
VGKELHGEMSCGRLWKAKDVFPFLERFRRPRSSQSAKLTVVSSTLRRGSTSFAEVFFFGRYGVLPAIQGDHAGAESDDLTGVIVGKEAAFVPDLWTLLP